MSQQDLTADMLTRIRNAVRNRIPVVDCLNNKLNRRRVLSVPEILDHPQVAERGLITTFDGRDGDDRGVSVLGSGFRVSGERPRPMHPPPQLGCDSDAILAELGYSDDEISALRRKGIV